MRFYVDEDISPDVAYIGRDLGLDIISCHELNRRGLPDRRQLELAALDDRCFVTANRDDFIELTNDFAVASLPHRGVLVVPYPLSQSSPVTIARAILRYVERRGDIDMAEYLLDFIS